MSRPYCSCGACCDPCGHKPGCVRHEIAPAADREDGFPGLRAVIRHPSHAPTRRHLAANPMPQQKNRRADR